MKEPIRIQLPNGLAMKVMEMRSGDLLITIEAVYRKNQDVSLIVTEIQHLTIPVGHREVLAAHIKP